MATPITVTDTSFKEQVLDAHVPVLVDFWAAWCSPCKMIAPIVEALAQEYDGQVIVAKMDVDANPITPGMFGIMSIPTLMLFRGGKAEERIVGYQPQPAEHLAGKIERAAGHHGALRAREACRGCHGAPDIGGQGGPWKRRRQLGRRCRTLHRRRGQHDSGGREAQELGGHR